MNIFYVVMPLLFLFSFQDTTKNVLSSDQDTSITAPDIDSCDFHMDTAYAGHLYREAKVLMDSGEYDLALLMLSKSIEVYLSIGLNNDTLIGNVYLQKGVVFERIRDLDSAEHFLNKALHLWEEMYSNDHVKLAKSYYVLGSINLRKSNYENSLKFFRKSLNIRLKLLGEVHPEVGDVYNKIGIIWCTKGNYNTGLNFFEKACDIYTKALGEFHPKVATMRNNIGIVWKNRGEYDKAIENYQKSLIISLMNCEGKDIASANTFMNLGVSWSSKGNFERALSYYNRALSIYKNVLGDLHPDVAGAYSKMGVVMLKVDNIMAREYFNFALRIYLKHYDKIHPKIGFIYNMMGVAWTNDRNYKKALLYFEESYLIYKNKFGENHKSVSDVYNNIGINSKRQGDRDKALFYYNKSLNIKTKTLELNHPDFAHMYGNIGNLLLEKSKYEEAIEFYEKALRVYDFNFKENDPFRSMVLKNMGVIFRLRGNLVMSQEYNDRSKYFMGYNPQQPYSFEQTLDLIKLRSILLEERKCLDSKYQKLMNALYRDSLKQSNEVLLALEDYFQKKFSTVSTKQSYWRKSLPVYEGAIDILLLGDKIEEQPQAFQIAEKLKGRLLSEKMKDASFSSSYGIPDSLKEKEYDIGVDIAYYEKKKFKEEYEGQEKNDSLIGIFNDKLFHLKRQQDKLQESLKTDHPKYYNARYSQKVISVSGVQDSLLNPNQALLEYFVGDSSIFTFTILPDTFYVHQIKNDFPLDAWVGDMLHGVYDPYTSDTDTVKRAYTFQMAASNIYQKVFSHVDTLLPEGMDIILVPDGILGYIPFDALLTDSTNSKSYLIRDHQISYAYSATLQAEMENMQHDEKAIKRILAFAPSFNHSDVVGDTTYLASRSIDVTNERNWLTPLKYNDDEVRSISEMAGADLFLDSIATKEQFLQHASDYSIIHLSTHGKANDKMGDYSFLAFYDPKDSTESWLYNRELYGLKLNADMVVLSACETGIGELQRGEGIISLARGFSYAGAKSIVTTLWSVNDRSTQKVMELFYENLTQGMRKDAALRQAKLDYLDKHPNLGSAPYFWAGIIPIGDMSPISFQTPWYQNPWFWLGTLLLFGLIFWASRKFF